MKKLLLVITAIISLNQVLAQVTPTPLNLSSYNGEALRINPVSHDTVWAGVTGVNNSTWINVKAYSKTVNAGISWTTDTVPDSLDRGVNDFFALNGSTAWAVMGDFIGTNPEALFKTTDGGATWTRQLDSALTAGFFLNSVYFFSADSGLAMGDSHGGYFEIYTTIDGGVTWTRVDQENIASSLTGSEAGITSGYSVSGNSIWFNTNAQGRIFYSTDRGYSWNVSTVNTGWYYAGVAFNDATHGVAWKDNNNANVNSIYTSHDGGVTWGTQAISPPIALKQVSEVKNVPGTFLFTAGSPVKLYATSDNFITYSLIDQSHTYANTPYWSAIKMFDSGLGWAADGPLSDSAVYKLENLLTGIPGLETKSNAKSFTVFPNPVTSGAALTSFTLEENSTVVMSLIDITGKIIARQTCKGVKGENALVFDFRNVSAGLYTLSLETAEKSMNLKVIVR